MRNQPTLLMKTHIRHSSPNSFTIFFLIALVAMDIHSQWAGDIPLFLEKHRNVPGLAKGIIWKEGVERFV